MKKILLGTSALIALGSVAFAAEAPKMTVSGSMAFVADIQKHSNNASSNVNSSGNNTGHDFLNGGGGDAYMNEIHFAGNGKTDSGLTYGAKYEWRPLAGAIDEAFIHFGGDWGKLTLGQDDNTGSDFANPGSWLATNGYDGIGSINTATGAAFPSPYVGGWSNASRVKYKSPTVAGLTVGADFAPSQGSHLNVVTAGVSYNAKMGGAGVTVNGVYSTGKAPAPAASDPAKNNLREWQIGGQVDVGAISVAAQIHNTGKAFGADLGSNVGSSVYKDIGVSYAVQEGTTISAAYSLVTTKTAQTATVTKDASWTLLSVGASTAIAPGASAFVEYNMAGGDNTGNVDGKGKWDTNQILIGTQVSF